MMGDEKKPAHVKEEIFGELFRIGKPKFIV